MKKFIQKLLRFFKKEKPIERKYIRLSDFDYDKLVKSKLEKIRKHFLLAVWVRDEDDLFEKQFDDAYSAYENQIKREVEVIKDDNRSVIVLSPHGVFDNFEKLVGVEQPKPIKIRWIRRIRYKIRSTIRRIKRSFNRLKFNVSSYWKYFLLLKEIRKIKKTFPQISTKQAIGLMGAVNLNKRILLNWG